MLEIVARALGALNHRIVYLGGCAVGLLITDPGRPAVRPTLDVDVIAEVATRADYYRLADELRAAGFTEASDESVVCRWRLGPLKVDVIPTDATIFGFSNKWLQLALDTAESVELPSSRKISLISAPLLLATKLEAFYDRGNGDYRASHDIEDIVNLIDGRPELSQELVKVNRDLRDYLREEFDELLANLRFTDALPGHLGPSQPEQDRLSILVERMRRIAGL